MSDSTAWMLTTNTVVLSSPLILAALGGYCSERGGVANIALEGKMLTAACVTGIAASATGSAWVGLAAGIAAAVLLSLVHWLTTQSFSVDAVVVGMAINVIALGATNYLDKTFVNPAALVPIPVLPINLYYAAAFSLPGLMWAHARWTRGGLRLLAVGSDPDKARQMGVSPARVRLVALIGTGVFCGLSGATIVTNAGRFGEGMTAGRGFIALAALILGEWRPIPAALACVGFGFCEAMQIYLQGTELAGARIPPEAWKALPYVVTVIALASFGARNRTPAGMNKV